MADFYCNHNLSVHIAEELERLGHQATTAKAEGLDRAPDGIHLMHAAQRGWVLLTADKDFQEYHLAWQYWATTWGVSPFPEHGGILIFE